MLNFIKSEYYRMIHTTGIRVFFGILSVLTILLISGISIVETQYHTNVNMSSCITAWDTTGGMLRCIIAGISGIIIFMAIGFRHIRKADL